MIIQCDKCGTKFELADDKIGDKGARVRCSKCKSVFTVKKPESTQEEPQAPAPSPPPQKESSEGPTGSEDDPFSDFSFNDDMDFSEGDEDVNLDSGAQGQSVPPPPEAGGEDLLEESPDVSFSKPPPAQEGPSIGGDDFDFPDSDFDFTDDADPDDSAASSSASEPPPAPPGAGDFADSGSDESSDDFGDIRFDEESFSEAPPQGGGGGEGPDVNEFGNVSLTDADKDAEKPSGMDDFDDLDTDFQFDSGGEEESMDMDVDDFVRSSKSRAPVSDDYEASISESEAESETPRQRPAAAPEEGVPPPPPKPTARTTGKKKSHGLRNFILVVFVFLIAVSGGILFYTNSKGWFTFKDLTSGNFGKLAEVPEKFMLTHGLKTIPLKGELNIDKKSFNFEESIKLNDGSFATVIWGKVENNTNKTMSSISVEVPLLDPETEEVIINESTGGPYIVWSYCGKSFNKDELSSYSQTAIELKMHEEPAAVPPDQSCDFMLVIPNVVNSIIDPGKISIRDREVEPDEI